jgi:hypothetical protein
LLKQRLNESTEKESRRKAEKIDRPRELQGSTWRIPFDNVNLYVTVITTATRF